MPGINYTNLKVAATPPPGFAAAQAQAAKVAAASGEPEGLFHRILDIVNPMQHLPVVGTIYRAMTGEHIGNFEKIAGDTLYGGLWGGVSSAADVAFEAVTGKSAEDTVLAWFKDDAPKADAPTAVAAATPVPLTAPVTRAASSAPTPLVAAPQVADASSNVTALSMALAAKGIDGDLANRALDAYRQTMTFSQMPVRTAAQ